MFNMKLLWKQLELLEKLIRNVESLEFKICFQELSTFYKIVKSKLSSYLFDPIPKLLTEYAIRNSKNLPSINPNLGTLFRGSFFGRG